MVNVPSPDKVHVISAWIVAKEKMLRKMSNRDFFINFENKKLGRRLSDSLVPYLRLRPSNLHNRQVYGKVHALHGHGTLRSLVLVVFENWPYSRYGEQEQIALCIFMLRKSVVAHPS